MQSERYNNLTLCYMSKLRILYATSEINPFLCKLNVGNYIRQLPEAMLNRGFEIRILMPRFGLVNERKNRLHEVVRLSGINISVGDDERPLVIKVASIPQAKLQVYFIDNDDLYQRKTLWQKDDGSYHEDNDERAIFFGKGVLETIRKLGWSPDIVHCNDWLTGYIPLYLKSTYKNNPLFKNSKVIFTAYDNAFPQQFPLNDMYHKLKMDDVTESMLRFTEDGFNYNTFVKMGAEHADAVTYTGQLSDDIMTHFNALRLDKRVEQIEEDEEYLAHYNDIYDSLISELVRV